MVGAGPFWGHCVFDNHEEVDCYPVYRDPVHDFGILRYDTSAIKYMLVDGLDLRPDQAKGSFISRMVSPFLEGPQMTNFPPIEYSWR